MNEQESPDYTPPPASTSRTDSAHVQFMKARNQELWLNYLMLDRLLDEPTVTESAQHTTQSKKQDR
ncbi:MAG: hypothetical protein SFV32_09260 [Opitutaceae bacterium]|nr:hypothetical protein [Opitutaceae bacterium]